MLTELRWEKEQELMQSCFPEFKPFFSGSRFGFEGRLKGHHSGQLYKVVLEADKSTYPQYPPRISIEPRVGHHWIGAGLHNLCVERQWHAARSTFANTLLTAIRYLSEHDGDFGSAPQLFV